MGYDAGSPLRPQFWGWKPYRDGGDSILLQEGDNSDALADHVIPGELPAKEERPMRTKRAATVIQATLSNAVTGISGMTEDSVTILVTTEGQNVKEKTDAWVDASCRASLTIILTKI